MSSQYQECPNTQRQRSSSKGSATKLWIFGAWVPSSTKWSPGLLPSSQKISTNSISLSSSKTLLSTRSSNYPRPAPISLKGSLGRTLI